MESLIPPLDDTLEAFGTERTMVGTNVPVELLFSKPTQILEVIRAAVEAVTIDARKDVPHRTIYTMP